jgi:hypothetical protein
MATEVFDLVARIGVEGNIISSLTQISSRLGHTELVAPRICEPCGD